MMDASNVAIAEIESVSRMPLPILSKKGVLRSGEKKRVIKGAIFESAKNEKNCIGLSPK
jgi:hypothetical protein